MTGVLGTSGGGAAGVTSVTAGNGITVTGTTTPTIAASLAAGTGVSIAGTTTLTVSATGVNSVSAGTGISVSGTTALTVSATGVNSIVAGTAISVSGSTQMTVTNTGVTALAGTGISVSAATGSVTVTPTYAAPTALTIGGTVVTGAAASVSNSAHVHAMPGSAVAGASAVGDTAATGSATTVALSDHKHSREAFGTPFAVTGGATAASGSATTIARSDHVHSTASMPALLASTTLASDTASVTFSSISQSYRHLMVMYQVRITGGYGGALEYLMMRCNGDTGGNYWDGVLGSTTATMAHFASTSATTNYDTAFSCGSGFIYSYTNTLSYKTFGSFASPWNNSTTAYSQANWYTGYSSWRSTVAVTSITFLDLNGFTLKSGSNIQIYGYP